MDRRDSLPGFVRTLEHQFARITKADIGPAFEETQIQLPIVERSDPAVPFPEFAKVAVRQIVEDDLRL